ncbi:MAG: hypothetical protein ACTH8P_16720 [Ewingella sp.]|uniref:hypothetical protein n=1 Tax=Ewingella sp. TaxID=1897459 RepID=UPI003F9049DB
MASSFAALCSKAQGLEIQKRHRRAAVAWREALALGLTEKERDQCASNAARCSYRAKYQGKPEAL